MRKRGRRGGEADVEWRAVKCQQPIISAHFVSKLFNSSSETVGGARALHEHVTSLTEMK